MRRLLVLLFLGFAVPAGAQAPATDEKTPDKPDWAALLGFDRPAAQARYDDEHTPEGWAWSRIKQDKIADLNLRCDASGKTRLDPHEDAGWDDACRKIPAGFITDVLTVPRWRDRIGRHGLRLRGARIDGELDLANVDIRPDLLLEAGRIEGGLDLTGAHLAGLLSLRGTQLRGGFAAARLRADNGLLLRDRATFKGDLTLNGAKIAGQVDMDGSAFEGTVSADSMSVEANLLLGDGATFRGNVILSGARVGANVEMDHSAFGGTVNADGVAVERSLFLRGATLRGSLNLGGARIAGQVALVGSAFEQAVLVEAATIGESLFARDVRLAQPLVLASAHIGGGLDLRGAIASRIDLTNAVIGDDLTLGDAVSWVHWQCAGLARADSSGGWPLGERGWRAASCGTGEVPALVLRNTRAGALQDSAGAWPAELDLEGFRYDRLGGSGAADMRRRSPEQWQDWLERDRVFSTQPTTQLAGVLLAAGHRDTADIVLYAGRERERREALARGDLVTGAWLTLLWAVSGYGIGAYAVRVVYWVAGLGFLGWLVVWSTRKRRRRAPRPEQTPK